VIFILQSVTPVAAEVIYSSKAWYTDCKENVFDETSKCYLVNPKSKNSERLLLLELNSEDQLALVLLAPEEVEDDFEAEFQVSLKVDKNKVIYGAGNARKRNDKYYSVEVSNIDLREIIIQMKKGSNLFTKVSTTLSDYEILDKFSLSGFTINLNKAASKDGLINSSINRKLESTEIESSEGKNVYSILKKVNLFSGGTHAHVLTPELSKSTDTKLRAEVAKKLMVKEQLDSIMIYQTRAAWKANQSESYLKKNPNALDGYLGSVDTDGNFTE